MKKTLLILLIAIMLPTLARAQGALLLDIAIDMGTDTSSFNKRLSATDDNIQDALDTLDDYLIDMSSDTNLVAGNSLTLIGNTLNVDDVFVLNTGDSINGDIFIQDTFGLVIGHTSKINFGAVPEFQILGTGASDSSFAIGRWGTASGGPTLRFFASRNTVIGSNTVVLDGKELGRIRFQMDDGTDNNTNAAEISAEIDGTPGQNDAPGRILFSTASDGSSSVTERMRIDSQGRVGIGDTDPVALLTVGNGDLFQVDNSGNVLITATLTVGGTADISGGVVLLPSNAVDDIAEIATTIKTGSDAKVVTGTAGSTNNCAKWDANGDLVDHGSACGSGGGSGTNIDFQDSGVAVVTSGTLDAVGNAVITNVGGIATLGIADAYVLNTGDTMTGGLNIQGTLDVAGTLTANNGIRFNLPATENIVIDGRSNPREITQGLVRINHTPEANTENTRAMFFDVDFNSVPNTEAIHMSLMATSMAAGETMLGIDIEADMNASTGGVVRGLNFSKVGIGSGEFHAIHIEPEVEIVISHSSGSFGSLLQGWDENGGFTDTTAAFNSSGTDVTIFDTNGDAIYIGSASAFSVISYVFNTPAGGAGVKPAFEYSSGGGTPVWTSFSPTDGTAGFTEDGLMTWDIDDLVTPTWAVATVNGQSAFYIQITRTQPSIPTDPIEDLFEISTPTIYKWDGDGVVFVESLTTGINSRTVTSEGSAETVEIISHINDAFSETVEYAAMKHSDTAASGAHFYALRTRGSHASQSAVQDDDIVFHLRGEGHDGTDFNDTASIFFKVDGSVSANNVPGRIEFHTPLAGTNNLVEALRIDSNQNVGIGTGDIDTYAILELSATDKALLLTRVSDPSVGIATPVNGMIVYDSGDDQMQAYIAGSWVNFTTKATILLTIDGGGSAITTGTLAGGAPLADRMVIDKVTMFNSTNEIGSLTVDIHKVAGIANLPATPSDSITGSSPVTITSDDSVVDTTLTGWTLILNQGDILTYVVEFGSTMTSANIAIEGYLK